MGKKRTIHSASFKAKVALAAVKEVESVSQLASKYGVHPVTIYQWKKQLLEGAEGVFSAGMVGKNSALEERKSRAELYEEIGRLKMDLEWLKKKESESVESRRSQVEWDEPRMSVRRQCELLGLNLATAYYAPVGETPENLSLMRQIDEQ